MLTRVTRYVNNINLLVPMSLHIQTDCRRNSEFVILFLPLVVEGSYPGSCFYIL